MLRKRPHWAAPSSAHVSTGQNGVSEAGSNLIPCLAWCVALTFPGQTWANKCLLSKDRSPTGQRNKKPIVAFWWTMSLLDFPTGMWVRGYLQKHRDFQSATSPESHPSWMKTSFKRWKHLFQLPFLPPHTPALLRPHTSGVLLNTTGKGCRIQLFDSWVMV